MSDTAIRAVSIAESAQRSARVAADTLAHQPNPFDARAQPDEYAKWDAAYIRAFRELTTEDGQEGSA